MSTRNNFRAGILLLGMAFQLTGCGEASTAGAEAATEKGGTGSPFLEATYSTFLGGRHPDRAQGIHVDDHGYIYVVGQTHSKDFPTTPEAHDRAKSGQPGGVRQYDLTDGFVAKLTPDGGQIVWSTFIGGSKREEVYAVRVDSQGNVYATGSTGSPDFPVTPGAYDTTFNGPVGRSSLSDTFVAKFDRDGKLIFSTFLGGSEPRSKSVEDPRGAVHIDEARGLLYLAGTTSSTDFPTTEGAFQRSYGGGVSDGFVAALSLDGTRLVYSSYIGGSAGDMAYTEIEPHPDGSLYIAGATNSADFPVTPGSYQPRLASGHDGAKWQEDGDAFVARIAPALDRLVFSTYLGGGSFDEVSHNQGLAVDAAGRPVVVGMTRSSDFPTSAGAFSHSYKGMLDGFVSVLSEDGSKLEYSTYIGGAGEDETAAIFVGPRGRIHFSGSTQSSDYPITDGALQSSFGNGRAGGNVTDVILSVLTQDLGALAYSTYIGGDGRVAWMGERGRGIWITEQGSVYLTGVTDSANFPIIGPAVQPEYGGSQDGFLIRFDRR